MHGDEGASTDALTMLLPISRDTGTFLHYACGPRSMELPSLAHLMVLVATDIPQRGRRLTLRGHPSELYQPEQGSQTAPADYVVVGVLVGAQLAVDYGGVVLALVIQRGGHEQQASQTVLRWSNRMPIKEPHEPMYGYIFRWSTV